MRLFLFFTFCLIFVFAEIENLTNKNCENCQAVLPKNSVKKEREINSFTLINLNDKNQTIKELQPRLCIEKETPQKWIEITVNNDLNIYDLALRYYGDSQEYEEIYMANQNKIDKNYQIKKGMSLKIPITENFME